jgi:L-lactate dehydrogenase (cytochrome)
VQTVEDAKLLADTGVDGIVLSNHGGRQLDRAPVPFLLLPDVVREVGGDLEVHLDTGIMSGADIVASVALGARFTLVGRAYLYGLMAGGRRGVDKTIEILRNEIVRTMTLLEVSTLDELGPQHVTQLARLTPIAKPVADAAEEAVSAKPKTVRSTRPTATKAASNASTTTANAAATKVGPKTGVKK